MYAKLRVVISSNNKSHLVTLSTARTFFCDVAVQGGFRSLPHYLQNGKKFFDAVFMDGRASVYDFDDAQLMTVFEPEIKKAVINRK